MDLDSEIDTAYKSFRATMSEPELVVAIEDYQYDTAKSEKRLLKDALVFLLVDKGYLSQERFG